MDCFYFRFKSPLPPPPNPGPDLLLLFLRLRAAEASQESGLTKSSSAPSSRSPVSGRHSKPEVDAAAATRRAYQRYWAAN